MFEHFLVNKIIAKFVIQNFKIILTKKHKYFDMKKLILAVTLGLFLNLDSQAQMADGSIAPDFTTTDINGQTHRLYDYLDAGYTVILDLSATWCGPCWNYHIGGAFEEIWEAHGPAGQPGVSPNTTDDVMVLWVEGDPGTAVSELENSQLGNWTEPDGQTVNFPIINDDNLADMYELGFWPTIYTICPNRTLTLSGQVSAAQHYANLDDCPQAIEGSNAALASYNGTLAANGCETSASGNVSVTVQNMGTLPLTSFTVEVFENGNSIASQDYMGELLQYQTTDINFGNLTINSDEYEIQITSTDDNASDNVITQSLSFAGDTEEMVTVSLLTDNYASETYLEITDENGNVVWSQGNEAIAGQYDTGSETPPTDPTSPLTNNTQYNWEVGLVATGCYTLTVGDYYGDGLFASQWGGTDGNWSLKDNGNMTIAQMSGDDVFEGIDESNFENLAEGQPTSIQSLDQFNLALYPNPVVSNATLEITLNENSTANMNILDILGKVVRTSTHKLNAGNNLINFNVNDLVNGVYFVELNVNGLTTTKKITVTK